MPLAVAPNTTTDGGTGQTTASPATAAGAAVARVPFTRASNLHREPAYYDNTIALGTNTVAPPIIPVPAYGFLRSMLLKIVITPTGGTPAFAADGPFNVLTDITLKEPNGNPIVGPLNGYDLYLANKYGGYRNVNDPKQWYGWNSAAGAATFFIRIPLEIDVRDAIGSLPNQNSAATFQISYGLNTLANVFSAAPTSATVRIQAWAEEWDQPAVDTLGQSNETAPPAVNTTQFWSKQTYAVVNGANVLTLTRVGFYLRNLIFVTRDASGVRVNSLLPSLTQLSLDSQPLDFIDSSVWQASMSERYGYTGTLDSPGGLDTGVYVYDLTHDFSGRPGFETRNLWIYTVSSTRFQIQGTFGAAGQLQVLTNDVALANNVFLG